MLINKFSKIIDPSLENIRECIYARFRWNFVKFSTLVNIKCNSHYFKPALHNYISEDTSVSIIDRYYNDEPIIDYIEYHYCKIKYNKFSNYI